MASSRDTAPTLRGRGVVLRAFTAADLARLVEACRDPETQRWTSVPRGYTEADARWFVGEHVPRGWERNDNWQFAVAHKDDRTTYAGSVGLSAQVPGRAEVGWLTHPDARGQGLTLAAVRTALDWAFGPMGLHSVEWRAVVGHWASRRIAWRCGFRLEGTLRGAHQVQGGTGPGLDSWVGSLLADEPREPAEPWPAEAPQR